MQEGHKEKVLIFWKITHDLVHTILSLFLAELKLDPVYFSGTCCVFYQGSLPQTNSTFSLL